MSVTLSLFAGAGQQFFDSSGNPLTGGKIYTYLAGTTTPYPTYTNINGNVAHTNPIILDSAGRVPSGEIWLSTGVGYKFVLNNSADVLIATYDNIPSSAQPPAANDADSIQYQEGVTVQAGSFVIGETYKIATIGNTDFTLIGAAANTVGLYFTATGVGTGTGTAEFSRSVGDKFRDFVSLKDVGAVGDGVNDDRPALVAAFATGKAIYIPTGTYYISSSVAHSGPVIMYGDGDSSILTSNTSLFAASNASNSMLRDFRIERKDTPTTVVRAYPDFSTWTIGTTGEGYMPGINDDDGVWAALTPQQQAETGTWFELSAATDNAGVMGQNISIENISSNFGSLIVINCDNVTIRGCRLRGERASTGCIWIKNYEAVALGSPQAKNIVIEGNVCYHASYNPISVDGTNGAVIANNICYECGETGIKLWQDGTGDPLTRGNLHTTLTGNYCYYCYEDGYNVCSRYPNSNADDTYYVVTGNSAVGNNSSGFVVDGNYNTFSGNFSQSNALDGFTTNDWYSTYTGNFALDNNQADILTGRHEFVNNGEYNTWTGNRAVRTGSKNGNAFYFGNSDTLTIYNNTGIGTDSDIIYDSAIPGVALGNFGNGVPAANTPLRPLSLQTSSGITDSTNLTLGQENNSGNSVKIVFYPRSNAVGIDASAEILGLLGLGTPGAEDGLLYLRTVLNGTMGDKLFIDGNGDTNAGVDNTYKLGTSGKRWSEVFAANGTINTSDEREKEQINKIDDKVLKAWEKVNYVQFKFKDSVVKKGDGARWHFGLIAQRVKEAFESEGLDAFAYGLLCYDEWEEKPALMGVTGVDEKGQPLPETEIRPAEPAGNRYGIRYEQALALECAYLRSKLG